MYSTLVWVCGLVCVSLLFRFGFSVKDITPYFEMTEIFVGTRNLREKFIQLALSIVAHPHVL